MKCLVTGGAGFIGSHLCDRLVELGHTVKCFDNLRTGRKRNITQLVGNKTFRFIKDDVLHVKNHKLEPDVIFHLASPASPRWYQRYPIETLMVNTYGTYLLLELARRSKSSFLFASTSEIYGDPLEHPQNERYWGNVNPVGPRSCYDEAKRCGEAIVSSFMRKYKLDARIIRIFNTYGPRMDSNDGRVVSNFVYQGISGKPMTIYGNGSQTRSFCYVSDMVDGIIKAAFVPNITGEIINIGNPHEVTINKLAAMIADIIGRDIKKIYKDLPKDDPSQRRPTIEKARQLLGWEPKVQIEKGLEKTVLYFLKEYVS